MYTIQMMPRKHSKYATIKKNTLIKSRKKEKERARENDEKSNSLNSTHKYEADTTRRREKKEEQEKRHSAREFQ